MVSEFSPGADKLLDQIIAVLNNTEATPEEQGITLWALLTTFYNHMSKIHGKDNAYQNFYNNQENLGSLIRTNFDKQLVNELAEKVAREEKNPN